MALGERFSKKHFLEEKARDPSSRALADELASEVQRLLHEVLMQKIGEIAEELGRHGHNLRHYEPPTPGVIALRDDHESKDRYDCDLRLGVDTIVSSGFCDTIDVDPDIA